MEGFLALHCAVQLCKTLSRSLSDVCLTASCLPPCVFAGLIAGRLVLFFRTRVPSFPTFMDALLHIQSHLLSSKV